jgi:hypothetical protein
MSSQKISMKGMRLVRFKCCIGSKIHAASVKLSLGVSYPEDYPNVLPDLSLEPVEGDFSEEDLEALLTDIRTSVSFRSLHLM